MKRNSNDNEMKQLLDHHEFVVRTDRKSLHTQIKYLVQQAQEVALKELNQRRKALQALLEYEDKLYEEEFANKVKSRIDEDKEERKEILLKIKEESTKKDQEFLKSKRVHQYMNSCYEIREALRHQETQKVKECQLEQMMEKDRTLRKEQELENFWHKVQQKNIEVADKRQQEENTFKKALVKGVSDTLKIQVEELEEKREKLRQERLEEKQKLDDLLEKIRLEKFDLKQKGKPSKIFEYRKELFDMMAEKQLIREKEEKEKAQMHLKMIDDLARIEAEETAAAVERKKAFHKATVEYIQYVRRMRDFGLQQQRMYDERIDDLRRVDICTKNNIQREKQRKARVAEECYAELRKQICEQYERRLREETEMRESKILENRFVRDEITRDQLHEQRRKNREGLDKQIAEMKRIREAEELKFNHDLKRASNDPEFCSELAEQYIREGTDYLEPHPNWHYAGKPLASNMGELFGHKVWPRTCMKPGGYEDDVDSQCATKCLDGRGNEKK